MTSESSLAAIQKLLEENRMKVTILSFCQGDALRITFGSYPTLEAINVIEELTKNECFFLSDPGTIQQDMQMQTLDPYDSIETAATLSEEFQRIGYEVDLKKHEVGKGITPIENEKW